MPLTDAQYTALWIDISVTHAAEHATMIAATDDPGLAAVYSLVAVPDFWVYRTLVTKEEVVGQTSQDGTIFTWAGNGFLTKTNQEILTWQELFDNEAHAVNFALPQNRTAFNDIFSGTGNSALNNAHCRVVARRKALRTEQLFATGTGSTASPALLSFEGTVNYLDIYYARTGVRP